MAKEGGNMKRIQGKNIVGYVTIQVKGNRPESFFQACAMENIPAWNIHKNNHRQCSGNIYLHHMNKVTTLAENYSYEIEVIHRKGYINYISQLWKRKELILSIILCSAIIFFLSNIVWKVDIIGVSTDVEEKLNKELASFGLHEGAWIYSLESLDIVQEQVLHEIPELLYIGIEKKGTTYTVDAVEKLIVEEEEALPSQHLVATKNGVIDKMFIKKGLPTVNVNDYVKKGDLLVSGIIEEEKEEEEQDEDVPPAERNVTSAEGKVYANTWYEVQVNSSLYHSEEKLSGEKITKYYLNLGNVRLPIWGFKKIPFEQTLEESKKRPVYLLKWKLPFSIYERTIYDKTSITQIRDEEEAKNIAIEHVTDDLKVKLGADSKVLKYYVLHESEESGKVKLNLYISVLENIATGKAIQ